MALAKGLGISLLLGYALITMPANAQEETSYSFQGLAPGFDTGQLPACNGAFGPCGVTLTGPVFDFTLPQFNPALGTLQSFSINFEGAAQVTGTFTNPPLDTGGAPCGSCGNSAVAQLNFVINGSVTAGGSSAPLTGSPSGLFLVGQIGQDGGTASPSGFGDSFGGINSGLSNSDVTGTGNLKFAVFPELDLQDVEAASASLAVDTTNVLASVDYSYTPSPTPEPSFLLATGGLLGVLGWVAWRKNVVARRS